MKNSSSGVITSIVALLGLAAILFGTILELGSLRQSITTRSKAETTQITCVSQSSPDGCSAVIKNFTITLSKSHGANDYVFAGTLCFDNITVPSNSKAFIEFKAASQSMGKTQQIITLPSQARCSSRGIPFSMLIRSYPGSCPDVHAFAGITQTREGQVTTVVQSEYSVSGEDICTLPTPTPTPTPTTPPPPTPTSKTPTPTATPGQYCGLPCTLDNATDYDSCKQINPDLTCIPTPCKGICPDSTRQSGTCGGPPLCAPTPIPPTAAILPTISPTPTITAVPTATTPVQTCKLYAFAQITDAQNNFLKPANLQLWSYKNDKGNVGIFKEGKSNEAKTDDLINKGIGQYHKGDSIYWTLSYDKDDVYQLKGSNVQICDYNEDKNTDCTNIQPNPKEGGGSEQTAPITLSCDKKIVVGWWFDKKPTGSLTVRADIATGNPADLFLFDTRWFDAGATPLTGSITLTKTSDGKQFVYPLAQANGVLNQTIDKIPAGDYSFSINLPEGLFKSYIDEVESSYYDSKGIKRNKWKKDYSYKREPKVFNEKGSEISLVTVSPGETPTLRVLYNTNFQVQYLSSRKECEGCSGKTLGIIRNWIAGDIACVPDFKKNDEGDPFIQPGDLKACVDAGIPQGGPGCFCYNESACRGIGGTPVGKANENYCSVVGDVLCSVQGGECKSDQKVPNFCCNRDADCPGGSKCDQNEPNRNVCQSGKKCRQPGGGLPPRSSRERIAGRGEISIVANPAQSFSVNKIPNNNEPTFSFTYEIKLPPNSAVIQLSYLSLQDRNGQKYVLREDFPPNALSGARVLPLDQPPGWTQSLPPLNLNIQRLILSKVKIPAGQDIRDFIARGELFYDFITEAPDQPNGHKGDTGSVPLIKVYQSGEANGRFEWWINKPQSEWPLYLKDLLTACKANYQACKSCRGNNCNPKDFPGVSCQQLPQECLDRIDQFKEKIVQAFNQKTDEVAHVFSEIFDSPCINTSLIALPETKLAKVFSTARNGKMFISPEGIKAEAETAIRNEMEENVHSPLVEISDVAFGIDPERINAGELAQRLATTKNLKYVIKLVGNKLGLDSLKTILKNIEIIDLVINTLKSVVGCVQDIPRIPEALAAIYDAIQNRIYGDSMQGFLSLSNQEGSQAIKTLILKICNTTLGGCDSKELAIDLNPGEEISRPFFFTSEDFSFPINPNHTYTLSCSFKYADGTTENCSDSFRLTTNDSGIIVIGVKQKSTTPTSRPSGSLTPKPSLKKLPKNPDINGDGVVNAFDYAIAIQYYGKKGDTIADLNNDLTVNALDLSIILDKLLQNK